MGLLEYPAVLAGAHNATQVVANRNAIAASRSQLDPGKTMTAAFMDRV